MRFFILSITLLLLPLTIQGQGRWTAEFRPGINFPTKDIGSEELNTGFGFQLEFGYRLMPHLRSYTGWTWNNFENKSAFGTQGTSITETSFLFGFELTIPKPKAKIDYYLFLGTNFGNLKVDVKDIDMTDTSPYKFGWHTGLGIEYSFLDQWNIRSNLRYHSQSGDISITGLPTNLDLSYVSFGIGLMREF